MTAFFPTHMPNCAGVIGQKQVSSSQINLVAIAMTFEYCPSFLLMADGSGPKIRVPTGSNLSLSRIALLESYRGSHLLGLLLLTIRALCTFPRWAIFITSPNFATLLFFGSLMQYGWSNLVTFLALSLLSTNLSLVSKITLRLPCQCRGGGWRYREGKGEFQPGRRGVLKRVSREDERRRQIGFCISDKFSIKCPPSVFLTTLYHYANRLRQEILDLDRRDDLAMH